MSCLNYTHVVLAGRITHEPEVKNTSNNVPFVEFDVAVSRKRGDEEVTDFFTVIAWKSRAEFVGRYFHKGMAVFVTGSLQLNKWEDKNGNKRTKVEILADDIRFIDSKKDVDHSDEQIQEAPPSPPAPPVIDTSDFEDILSANGTPF